jgi:hypothetical protein
MVAGKSVLSAHDLLSSELARIWNEGQGDATTQERPVFTETLVIGPIGGD